MVADCDTEFLSEKDLEDYYEHCVEMGPISGNHTTHANEKLFAKYPRHPIWKTMIMDVMMLTGSDHDSEMAHCMGMASNYINGMFLKPQFPDMVTSLHTMKTNAISFNDGRPLSTTAIKKIKDQWGYFNGKNEPATNLYWAIAKREGRLWHLLEAVIYGRVKRLKGRPAFKKPGSCNQFIHMMKVPDDVIEKFLTHVVDGLWTMRAFVDECKRYKATMSMRKLVLEYMVTKGWLPDGASWSMCQIEYPVIDDAWVGSWIRAIMLMPATRQTLPENAKSSLMHIHEEKVGSRRTQVHLLPTCFSVVLSCIVVIATT
jgi:hypothetical protein